MTGVIFDLDGTLLDTLEDLLDATNYALNVYGFPERTLEEMRRFVGNGALNQIRLSLPQGTGEEMVQRVLDIYRPYYARHCQIKTKPYKGIPQALAEIGKKYPVAIVSNKPDLAVKPLCQQYFPGIYALGETAGVPRKPAADMVYKAMEAIGVETCVYVGDIEVDVLTAKNAAVPCLSVLWGFRDEKVLRDAGAEAMCREPAQLMDAIEKLVKERF